MQYVKCFVWAIAILTLISACKKDKITTKTETTLEEQENVNFLVFVENEDNLAIGNATITDNLTGNFYTTNNDGLAFINNQTIPATGLPITISKNGYFKEIALLQGREKSKNTITFTLQKGVETIIASGSGGDIDGGGRLQLPTEIIDQNGQAYTGNVYVQSRHFSPDDTDFLRNAPGNMLGMEDGELRTLASYGMYTIELKDAAGNELQLSDSATATLEFPIADNQLNDAPPSIPLWYLDENTAMWQIEGPAIRTGNSYLAEVSHFSSWNCDIWFDPIQVCFRALDENGNILPNTELLVSSPINLWTHYDYGVTNDEGEICLFIPENEEVVIRVVDGYEIISTPTNIEPQAGNADLGDISFQVTPYRVTGNAVDCNGTDLDAVSIRYEQDGQTQYMYSDGNFELTTWLDNDISMRIFDAQNNQVSEEQQITFTSNDVNLGNVEVCENITTGQEIPVPPGYVTSDVTWSSGNTYILQGFTTVSGATLTIEAGVIVKAEDESDDQVATLIIADDGQIQANGTATQPIIFTSVYDNIQPGEITGTSLNETDTGLWGGIFILGKAPVTDTTRTLYGIPEGEYGGNEPNHNSGSFTHVSIRHSGLSIWQLQLYVKGLTLAGVGSETVVSHVEIAACSNDGVEILGGTVNPENIAVVHPDGTGFEINEGYDGTLENIIYVGMQLDTANSLNIGNPYNSNSSNVFSVVKQGSMYGGGTFNTYPILYSSAQGGLEDIYFFGFPTTANFGISGITAVNNFQSGLLSVTNCAFNDTRTLEEICTTYTGPNTEMIVDEIFASSASGNSVTSTPTVGADISQFTGWTWADANGVLSIFE